MKKKYILGHSKDFIINRCEHTGELEYSVTDGSWKPFFENIEEENAVHHLLNHIDELEERITELGWEASGRHAQATGGWM